MFRLTTWTVKTLYYSQYRREACAAAIHAGSFLGRNILAEKSRVGARFTTRSI